MKSGLRKEKESVRNGGRDGGREKEGRTEKEEIGAGRRKRERRGNEKAVKEKKTQPV